MSRAALEKAVVSAMDAAGRSEMQWGVDDCALWFANIIRDALGYDPAKDYRGRYKTRNGARRLLGIAGLKGAVQKAARRHKWKRINPESARVGDVGLAWTMIEVRGKKVATLATVVCRAKGWFVGRNERGFTGLSTRHVVMAWSVLDDALPGLRVAERPFAGRESPVQKEPVSIGVAILSFVGVTGASAAVAGFVGSLALMLTSFAVSMIASMLQPQRGSSIDSDLADSSNPQSVQVTERQSIPYRRHILGSAYVGGALFYEQVKPPYLTLGVLVNEGRIASFDRVVIGTNVLSFPAGITPNTILTPTNTEGAPDYQNRLKLSVRLGETNPSPDPLILNDYPNVGSTFQQCGIATAVVRYHFGANQDEFIRLWGQVQRPNAYFFVRGELVYDPRNPLHVRQPDRADYASDALYKAAYEAARATWSWTDNATLLQAYYLTQEWGGMIPPSRIKWDKIVESANYDDTVVGCKDGTFFKRHTISGVITTNQQPMEVLPKLLTANRGMVLTAGGYVWVQSSQPRTPILTINDKMLSGSVKYQGTKPKRDLINKLQVRIVVPNQDYQIVDGPVLNRTDLQLIDKSVLPATLSLDFTLDDKPNCPRAQRLQKLYLDSSRLGKTITVLVKSSVIAIADDELIGAVVNFESSLFTSSNGQYLVTSVGFTEDTGDISLALIEYDAALENNYDPAVDEKDFTLADVDVS